VARPVPRAPEPSNASDAALASPSPAPDSAAPAPPARGGALQAFLHEGHAWVAALAAVAGVVVTVIIALNGSAPAPPPPAGGASSSAVAESSTPEPSTEPSATSAPSDAATATPVVAGHEVPASCVGCTASERLARQDAVDTIVARIAVIDGDSCVDSTDTFDGNIVARVGCSFPGGYDVDYTLWSDASALAGFTQLFTAMPDAVILEWHLFGDAGPRTGDTVEWVQDGLARFYWTYDEFLIAGNAALSTGEQDRLNDWWRTTASLMRES